jgi:hypothetical protein
MSVLELGLGGNDSFLSPSAVMNCCLDGAVAPVISRLGGLSTLLPHRLLYIMEFRFSPEGFRGFGRATKGLSKKLTTPDNSSLFYFCGGFFT